MTPDKIEEKLLEYRRRKEREREAALWAAKPLWERVLPEKISSVIKSYRSTTIPKESPVIETTHQNEEPEGECHKVLTATASRHHTNVMVTKSAKPTIKQRQAADLPELPPDGCDQAIEWDTLQIFLLLLKILLWIVVFLLFVELEWGAVFVLFSAFGLIFSNFSKSRRKPWERSAYSVFNPGCEAIDGTLNAEQFEREIRHGF